MIIIAVSVYCVFFFFELLCRTKLKALKNCTHGAENCRFVLVIKKQKFTWIKTVDVGSIDSVTWLLSDVSGVIEDSRPKVT